HNIAYQGKYGKEVLNEVMGIPMYHANLLEYDGNVNMMKGAIETADKITTVSPSYAWEILDPWYSHGLDRALTNKQYKLTGFLNGIDVESYNPETDDALAEPYQHFSVKDPSGKAACKRALQQELGLPEDDQPLIGICTRFVAHKGIDLIRYVFEEMVHDGFHFAVLGSGERIYEDFFKEMAWRYPQAVSVTIGFFPQLARRLYAGCDMFLMPSQSEPCGLAQMYAMRYGTMPIVRETGGLRDSVRDAGGENGTGFTFKTYNAHDMLGACLRAKGAYENKPFWAEIRKNAMSEDFSWASSAELYLGLYKELEGWNQ
nr:glycogen/starch synthase [Oscillospiraceae bacterium]